MGNSWQVQFALVSRNQVGHGQIGGFQKPGGHELIDLSLNGCGPAACELARAQCCAARRSAFAHQGPPPSTESRMNVRDSMLPRVIQNAEKIGHPDDYAAKSFFRWEAKK